jgi:hypothetical protein
MILYSSLVIIGLSHEIRKLGGAFKFKINRLLWLYLRINHFQIETKFKPFLHNTDTQF